MMKQLKGVIFSLRDVIFHSGKIDPTLFAELEKLILWLKKCGVTPVFVSNRPWVFAKQDGSKENVELTMNQRWGQSPWYIASRGDIPYKPQAAAIQTVLQKQGWQHNEVIYVGNTDDDMKTARNGKVLFLNAQWHGQANPYGYLFNSPLDVARFIDCFCLNTSDWFWAIEKPPLHAYAVAPFSTLSRNYLHAQQYSAHARNTAKHLGGDATFWGRLLASRVYFSGLVDQINYITHYPGHSPQSKQPVVSDALTILADSLQRRYIPDLLCRHAAAKKSQTARTTGQSVDHLHQLNTIYVEQHPIKDKKGGRYKTSPLRAGKSVLVVDDICTQGNSFEAARAFIRGTGAETICLSWLKTINTDYRALGANPTVQDPYKSYAFQALPAVVDYPFSTSIRNNAATVNLDEIFQSYYQWDWPN